MKNTMNIVRIPAAILIAIAVIISGILPANAKTPTKESVQYLGSGKVEVEFVQDVDYKSPKVTVKDSSGKSYKAVITHKDDDELKFRIKEYKKGRTYSFTISGVRREHSRTYGKVSGTVKIPATAGISRTKAKSIAKEHAIRNWNITESSIHSLECETDSYKGVSVWEVSFESGRYEYEYKIKKSNGSIVKVYRELD